MSQVRSDEQAWSRETHDRDRRPWSSSIVAARVSRKPPVNDSRSSGPADGQRLGYMWGEPEIVALEDGRYDVALVVDDVHRMAALQRTAEAGLRDSQILPKADFGIAHKKGPQPDDDRR